MSDPYVYQEYPKALYVSPLPGAAHLVASDEADEKTLRAAGARPLAEWYEEYGVPDDESWPARTQARMAAAAADKAAADKANKK